MPRMQPSFLKQHRKRMTSLAALAAVAAAWVWWCAAERSAWRLQATLPSDGGVREFSVSPNGSFLAVCPFGNDVALWELSEQRVVNTIKLDGGSESAAFSPDGSLLAIGSWREVQVWDLASSEMRIRILVPGDVHAIESVAFSPNGRILGGACDDGTIRLWDVATGSEIERLESSNEGFLSIAYSPDSRLLAAGGRDGTLEVWTLATSEKRALVSHEDEVGDVWSVAFSPDGKTLAAAVDSPGVVLWDVATWSKWEIAELPEGSGSPCIAFSPDGSLLVAGTFVTWPGFWQRLPFIERLSKVFDLDVRPHGAVHVYDTATLREIGSFKAHRDSVDAAVFSPDGRTLITGGNITIKLWEVPN